MTAVRKHLLIPFRGIRDAGQDMAAGSVVIGRHIRRIMMRLTRRAWSAAWSGESLQDRLESLAIAVLACIVAGTVAGAVLGAAAVFVVRVAAPSAPALLVAAAIAWVVAAQFAAPAKHPEARGEAPPEDPSAAPVAFLQWLLQTMGDQPGIHLRELYPAMRELPGQKDRDDTELRGALRTLGIPVHRSLRIGRVAGRSGVRRADVQALVSPVGEPPVQNSGDAGQSAYSPVLSTVGEGMESA